MRQENFCIFFSRILKDGRMNKLEFGELVNSYLFKYHTKARIRIFNYKLKYDKENYLL